MGDYLFFHATCSSVYLSTQPKYCLNSCQPLTKLGTHQRLWFSLFFYPSPLCNVILHVIKDISPPTPVGSQVLIPAQPGSPLTTPDWCLLFCFDRETPSKRKNVLCPLRLTFCWPIFCLSMSTSLTGSGSGDPGGPSPSLSSLLSVWTWEEEDDDPGEEGGIDGEEEEEAPWGCAGDEDGEVTDKVGAAWLPRSVSCRSVSFSEASSCRSRLTLVNSLVRVSNRCLSWRTSSRARLRSARTWQNIHK